MDEERMIQRQQKHMKKNLVEQDLSQFNEKK